MDWRRVSKGFLGVVAAGAIGTSGLSVAAACPC